MKLKFIGTRGYIEPRTKRHYMHASCLVTYYHSTIMIDCGEDWLGKVEQVDPDVIIITHAHPDHAFGLKDGAPCPVYCSEESMEKLKEFPIEDLRLIEKRKPTEIEGISVEAFPVDHSTRAPAVGYRMTAGRATIFYVPDLVYIHNREEALKGVKIYIGDGATVDRSMVRKPGDELIGHVPFRTQLTWCEKEGVPRAIATHCGTQIVNNEGKGILKEIQELARERGVEVQVAYDGMEVVLR